MIKKLIKSVTFFFIFLFLAKNVNALQFEKYQNNPLQLAFINNYINQQQANIFFEDGIYKGVITIHRPPETYHSLGYFESSDGVNWIMKKEILNTGSDLSNPSILKIQTGYMLFFTRYDDNTIYRIYSSNCDFEFNCSSSFLPIIFPNESNNSEKKGVFAGRTYKQNDQTFMFFGAWGTNGFKLKLAYSGDLFSWQRCPNEFLYGGDGPFPYQIGSELYLFFHRSDSTGIKYAKTSLPLSCDSIFIDQGYLLTRDKVYDQKHLVFPSVLTDGNELKVYYSGLGSDSQWKLSLACTGQACLLPTPSPTIILTPTPIATETPTPTLVPIPTVIPEAKPIIIIPGFMASWNRDAILHNQIVGYSAWKLQNFVTEYDGLMSTLKNIEYQEEVNLFIFPYDWRQSIEKTTTDLNNYLQEKIWNNNPSQKINIVGHSLGGLIGRIFTQKNLDKVNRIITIGSPHQGAVQVYKPLESGEIDRDNTFLWLAEKIVLILNKSTIETDRVTFNNSFPVAKDLFPTFNFLKDLSGNEILIESMTTKNSFLSAYNQNFSDIFPIFTAIYGEKDKNTLAGYITEPQNLVDKLLGNYLDGRPIESFLDLGDYTILSKSSSRDVDSEKFYFDHSEIVTQKEVIKKILELLNIQFQNEQIVEGKRTIINPSLIFLIKSPATMSVKFESDIYLEDDGIIFIPNAQSGSYNLKVQGVDQGKYKIIVGQISEKNDIWESINGEILEYPPSSQIDNYYIQYNNQIALSIFPAPTITSVPTVTIIPSTAPTSSPTQTPTPTFMPTSTPTTTPQPTNSSSNNQPVQSKNDEIPISKESIPMVLGTLSSKEELIIPTIEVSEQTEIKKEAKKSSKNLEYIWPPIISLILGGMSYMFRKKILKK